MPTRTYTDSAGTRFNVEEPVEGGGDLTMELSSPSGASLHLSARLTAELVDDTPTVIVRFHPYAPPPPADSYARPAQVEHAETLADALTKAAAGLKLPRPPPPSVNTAGLNAMKTSMNLWVLTGTHL